MGGSDAGGAGEGARGAAKSHSPFHPAPQQQARDSRLPGPQAPGGAVLALQLDRALAGPAGRLHVRLQQPPRQDGPPPRPPPGRGVVPAVQQRRDAARDRLQGQDGDCLGPVSVGANRASHAAGPRGLGVVCVFQPGRQGAAELRQRLHHQAVVDGHGADGQGVQGAHKGRHSHVVDARRQTVCERGLLQKDFCVALGRERGRDDVARGEVLRHGREQGRAEDGDDIPREEDQDLQHARQAGDRVRDREREHYFHMPLGRWPPRSCQHFEREQA
mmetsp:Transcript_3852/g.8702  ORF Transcript_3852/g.8702 Transcript_3852/m.8702 type:complete len:274 (+) Transcript_3852:779-1600(+)